MVSLIERLKVWIKKVIIIRVLKQPSMARPSITDDKANFYNLFLGDGRRLSFVAEEIEKHGLVGRWRSEHSEKFEYRCCIPFGNLADYQVQIQHFYRGWEFKTNSSYRFIIGHLSGYHFWTVAYSNLQQNIFNRSKLARIDRMIVLEHILAVTLKRHDYRVNPIDLLTQLH